jgi:hypothetical protein
MSEDSAIYGFPKPKRWESRKYIAWIKTRPCIICGSPAEPHHIKGVGNLSGGAMKAPDWAVIPLCHPCHRQMHEDSEQWNGQWELALKTLGAAITEGLLKCK